MADPLAEFYSGNMLSPDRVGSQLVQAQRNPPPSSISDMYRGIYAEAPNTTAEGLNIRPVTSVQVDPRGNPVLPRTTVAAQPHIVDAANPLDINALGLTSNPFHPQNAAQRAIEAATRVDPIGAGPGVADMFAFLSGGPGTTDWSVADPGNGGLFGVPAQGRFAGNNTTPPAAAAPAPSISSMFAPSYNPTVDVTHRDPSAGGWGINGGGGIVAF